MLTGLLYPFFHGVLYAFGVADLDRLTEATGGRLFNASFFDKWEFWKMVSGDPALREHIPMYPRAGRASRNMSAWGPVQRNWLVLQ